MTWQYKQLESLCTTVKDPYESIGKNGYKESIAYTSYKQELTAYHQLIYKETGFSKPKFRKTITSELTSQIKDPDSLMVWYLDDGTLRPDGNACRLATQCFNLEENILLQDCLMTNFNIKSEIERWPKNQNGLCIYSRGGHSRKFTKLFADTVIKEIPSMKYKVHNI